MIIKKENGAVPGVTDKPKYVDNSAGQRLGMLGNCASRAVAALIIVGKVTTVEDACKEFGKLVKGYSEEIG